MMFKPRLKIVHKWFGNIIALVIIIASYNTMACFFKLYLNHVMLLIAAINVKQNAL